MKEYPSMGIPAAATACRNPDAPSEPNAENRRDEPHEHLERTLEKIRQARPLRSSSWPKFNNSTNSRAIGPTGSRANSENWRKCSPAVRIDRIIDKLPTV